jgi:hypothetical protein
MSFIDQQIRSFLNLGGCKEYSTMARAKFSGRNPDLTEAVPSSTASAVPNTIEVAAEAAASPVPAIKKTRAGRAAKRAEMLSSGSRANLAPINLDDEIRRLAYLLSERRGFEPGHETEDWLEAEREVLKRYQKKGA